MKRTHSIKRQMALLMLGLMGITLFLCWVLSKAFLVSYYTNQKQNVLQTKFTALNNMSVLGTIDEVDTIREFLLLCLNDNISIIGIGENMDILYYNVDERQAGIMLYTFGAYYFEKDDTGKTILSETDNYVLQRVDVQDGLKTVSYIEMYGSLENGDMFFMRTPMESIEAYANLTNEFLLIVGAFGMIISAFIMWFAAKQTTKPILELVDISKRMTGLDFEAKYTSGGKNEIALLGENFNKMSATLENNISELKSANNQLQKDIEHKTQIDEMRIEFLSNVSHELKTPIALIQGYAEGLKEGINDDAESREFYCDVIMDEAAKMNNMVKKLLSLNQLESGNDQIMLERFDIVILIQGIINASSILIQQKEVTVIFNAEDPVYVWGDEFKIEEVITNYFSNALNHVANNNIIEIRVQQLGTVVRTSVFNTGANIPAEDIDKVWIKFYKVDKARTREYGGSGIGLSIVKAIMDSLNGKYGADNYENGVDFWFELEGDIPINN